MNAEEIAEMREAMEEQRVAVREALAEDLGGDPEDYRADGPVADSDE
jgi:Xaa-Pro aminopeptidase